MPGIKTMDVDHKEIDWKFICTSCNLLLCQPMQTHCGHLMCYACLQALLESSNPRCPEDNTELKKEQVFPDVFTKRELKGLCLHCTNQGCSWHGTYEHLEEHSQICEQALIKCVHFQCQVKLQRSDLGEHLKSECEYRNVKCDFCGKDVAFASLKEHVESICEGAPVTCKYCKENVLRKDVEKHERHDCNEAPATCEFQAVGCNHDKTLKRKELRQHLNDGLINHVRLLLHHILLFVSQLSNYIPRPEFTGVMRKIHGDIAEVRSLVTDKFVKIVGLERRVESQNTRIESQNTKIGQIDESVALNTAKITAMESERDRSAQQAIHSYNGTLLWKIEGFQSKRQDAINKVKPAVYSPPFYSDEHGYKMCAKFFLNGDGMGEGSHLSLFFVVMKGDYDALQTWPFQKKITMMLLDQGNGDHMIDAFHSDPQSSCFQRPKSYMNVASGSPLFMPLHNLSNRQYIKDDVMFIKIIVD